MASSSESSNLSRAVDSSKQFRVGPWGGWGLSWPGLGLLLPVLRGTVSEGDPDEARSNYRERCRGASERELHAYPGFTMASCAQPVHRCRG
jgi:hypothetical protein